MRIFGILETPEGLSLDFLNNRVSYTMLLGALMFNYFYLIMFGGLTLLYNIITGFSMSSLVIGYFLHYAVPFEPEDFRKLTSELRNRIRDDASNVFSNLNIHWAKSLTTDTSDESDQNNIDNNNTEQIVNDELIIDDDNRMFSSDEEELESEGLEGSDKKQN